MSQRSRKTVVGTRAEAGDFAPRRTGMNLGKEPGG